MFRIRIRIRLDPHSNWAWIRDPDPYSESGSGFRIQVSKNRLKKLKFTRTDLNDKNRKCSDWATILTTVSSHFFKNILLLAIFSYLALLKSLSHRMDIFCWLCYYITMSHYKIDKNKEEKWFSSYKKLKIIFLYIWQGLDPGSGIRIQDPDPESGSVLRL